MEVISSHIKFHKNSINQCLEAGFTPLKSLVTMTILATTSRCQEIVKYQSIMHIYYV